MATSIKSELDELRAFGAMVARERITKGMTAAELSRISGISASTLSRIENGTRECRLGMMRILNGALGGVLGPSIKLYLDEGRFR